jgi:AcrR family transcriptional regulator
VVSPGPAVQPRLDAVPRSAAQTRILDAALELIGEHGVSGTSLQMIANSVGVTKAAVYHKFKSKNEIVLAVTERELGTLQDALDAAEAEPQHEQARKLLLVAVIDMAVQRRRWVSTLQTDPVIVRLLADHEPFQLFLNRLYAVLLGEDVGPRARVLAAILSAALAGAVINPLVADMDDDELRDELLQVTQVLLRLPD